MTQPTFANYEEFFTFYLSEHSDRRNRLMHAAGTVLGLCTLIVPIAVGHPWYALLWPVVSYGFAWTGHFLIEGNRPATLWTSVLVVYQRLQNAGSDDDGQVANADGANGTTVSQSLARFSGRATRREHP